jgi:hypothetical protein
MALSIHLDNILWLGVAYLRIYSLQNGDFWQTIKTHQFWLLRSWVDRTFVNNCAIPVHFHLPVRSLVHASKWFIGKRKCRSDLQDCLLYHLFSIQQYKAIYPEFLSLDSYQLKDLGPVNLSVPYFLFELLSTIQLTIYILISRRSRWQSLHTKIT